MKTKGNVLLAVFMAMTSAAAAQQVTNKQKAAVQTGAEVHVGNKGVNAGTSVRVEHSGEASVAKQQDTKAAAKSDTRVGQRADVGLRPGLDAVHDGLVDVGDEAGAAKKEGLEVTKQVAGDAAASADVSVNAAAAAAAEGSSKVKGSVSSAVSSTGGAIHTATDAAIEGSAKARQAASLAGGTLQSATKANAALEGTVKGAQAVPQAGEALNGAGELPVKPAINANTLVNGSLKSTAPVKLQAAGAVNNAMKINVAPMKAQVRNITAGRISVL